MDDKKEETSTGSSNEEMEGVVLNNNINSAEKQRLAAIDENVAMQDSAGQGNLAAESSQASNSRKREGDNQNPPEPKARKCDDGYVTEASMKSCSTVPRANRGPDQQQLDYRASNEDDQSLASMNDDGASLASRNTWKSMASILSHQQQLSQRREKDKEKYSAMSREDRRAYNAKRRDMYHRQSQEARQKQRQRARNRYHHISGKESVMSEAESVARKERRDKLQQERIRSKTAITTASAASES